MRTSELLKQAFAETTVKVDGGRSVPVAIVEQRKLAELGRLLDQIAAVDGPAGYSDYPLNIPSTAIRGAYLDGTTTISPEGQLIQGTGTLAGGDFTGLRIWRDANIGRLTTYNNGVVQVDINTQGQMIGGAGNVVIDADGISIQADTSYFDVRAYKFHNFASAIVGGMYMYDNPVGEVLSGQVKAESVARNAFFELFAYTQADTKFAAAELTSQSGVSSPTINTLAAKSRKSTIVSLIEVRDTVDDVRLQFDIYNTKFSVGGAVDSAITALFKDPSGTATIKIESAISASSYDAVVHAKVFGTSAGDPKSVYEIPSGSSWQVGVDNSDSDKFKIAQSSDQSWTNTLITVDAGQDLVKVGTDWIQGADATSNLRFITLSIANDGTAQLLDIAKPHAIAFIIVPEDGVIAIYTVHKNANVTREISDPAGFFSPTAGTAASVNIYYSAGNTRYEIENKRGGTRSFYIFYFAGE